MTTNPLLRRLDRERLERTLRGALAAGGEQDELVRRVADAIVSSDWLAARQGQAVVDAIRDAGGTLSLPAIGGRDV